MNNSEILKFCVDNGLLLDSEVLGLFDEIKDVNSIKLILEKIKESTNQRVITKNLFNQNKEKVSQILTSLPNENQQAIKKLKINFGLNIEISKEIVYKNNELQQNIQNSVKVLTTPIKQKQQ
jgi:hypothetical protein